MLKRLQLLNERHAKGDNKGPLEPTACNSTRGRPATFQIRFQYCH